MRSTVPTRRALRHLALLAAACASASLGAAPTGAGHGNAPATLGGAAPAKAYFQSLLQATETTAPRAPHPLLTGDAAEPRPSGHNVFLAYLAQNTSAATGVATLHDVLVAEEGVVTAVDAGASAGPQPRRAKVDSLLADLATALSTIEEPGDAATLLAARPTEPGVFPRVDALTRARLELR